MDPRYDPAHYDHELPDKDEHAAALDEPYVPDVPDQRPTPKQMRYLRTLAERTGQTFAYPRSIQQASREIRRLLAQAPSDRLERRLERRDISNAIARGPQDATRVDLDNETTGYGSTARWR